MAERDGLMLAQLMHEPYADMSETHSAVVFFVGDRAYKLKKPLAAAPPLHAPGLNGTHHRGQPRRA